MQVPHFTGRIGVIFQLHAALTKHASNATSSPIVLFGPGGVGKTQIALEYVNRHQNNYSSIIWIDGTSPESVRRSFTDVASQLLDHYDAYSLNSTSIYRRLVKVFQPPGIGLRGEEALPIEVERPISEAKKAGPIHSNGEVPAGPARPSSEFNDYRHITAVEVILDWLRMAQNKYWLLVYDTTMTLNRTTSETFSPIIIVEVSL